MRKILLIIFIYFPLTVYGEVVLNLTLVHKKGVNKGLVLVSELHSLEKIRKDRPIILKMKNGHMVKLKAKVLENKVEIMGEFFDHNKGPGVSFTAVPLTAQIDEEKNIELKNSGDQLLLLRILPKAL